MCGTPMGVTAEAFAVSLEWDGMIMRGEYIYQAASHMNIEG